MSQGVRSKRHPIAPALAGLAMAGAMLLAPPAFADLRPASALAIAVWDGGEAGRPAQGRVEDIRMADADCSAAAAEAAAQTGGQVLSVSSRDQGGRTVCIVTVLVPGEDGQRPRKRTLTLPQ